MSDRADGKPSKRAAVSVAIAAVRDELKFKVRRLAMPIQPHEITVKAQLNKVARLTGLPPRRVKDIWHGYLNTIPAHQDRTIRAAYEKWRTEQKQHALQTLQEIEAENETNLRAAADYSSSRWERVSGARPEARDMGTAAPGSDGD